MSGTIPGRELATLRECQDRALHREGIPMFLALVDEVGDAPAADPGQAEHGRIVAEGMDSYRRALLPSQRDGDMGAVVSVLQALAYADLGDSAVR